jgi:hypothetical protein
VSDAQAMSKNDISRTRTPVSAASLITEPNLCAGRLRCKEATAANSSFDHFQFHHRMKFPTRRNLLSLQLLGKRSGTLAMLLKIKATVESTCRTTLFGRFIRDETERRACWLKACQLAVFSVKLPSTRGRNRLQVAV